MLKIGFLGCGEMASVMAKVVESVEGVEVAGVAARERAKAKKFAVEFCPEAKVYSNYEKLVAAEDIDLIYISTPAALHCEHAILALSHHKNVLVEKPFTLSKNDAERIFFEAKNRGLFACEAMWTSFMPLHKQVLEWIGEGKIGDVKYISANLGYDRRDVERFNSPELGGGAFADLGVYILNLATAILGNTLSPVSVKSRKTTAGVDKDTAFLLENDSGAQVIAYVTMCANTDKHATIVGQNGYISIDDVNTYRKISLCQNDAGLVDEIAAEGGVTEEYAHEIRACADAVSHGLIQCTDMPWSTSAALAELCDKIKVMM